jgi:hypothetical protein
MNSFSRILAREVAGEQHGSAAVEIAAQYRPIESCNRNDVLLHRSVICPEPAAVYAGIGRKPLQVHVETIGGRCSAKTRRASPEAESGNEVSARRVCRAVEMRQPKDTAANSRITSWQRIHRHRHTGATSVYSAGGGIAREPIFACTGLNHFWKARCPIYRERAGALVGAARATIRSLRRAKHRGHKNVSVTALIVDFGERTIGLNAAAE